VLGNRKSNFVDVPDLDNLPTEPHDPHVQPGFEVTVVVPVFNERANVEPLIARIAKALEGLRWQIIYVDDNSPDGTAEAVKAVALNDPRVSCLRRVGRRGLAGAILEGMLASAAPHVAVIDGDLQHDETLLRPMFETLRANQADLVIASRSVGDGEAAGGFSGQRAAGSRFATTLARLVLKSNVTDPVSGFFAVRRSVVDDVAPKLSTEGFKILFDMISALKGTGRIAELPYRFRERQAGASKLDSRVVIDYLGLILSRASNNIVSPRMFLFSLVGASGVAVHLTVLRLVPDTVAFFPAQVVAALVAMTTNYFINNAVTYRDRRRRGFALVTGYLQFCALCSVGFLANLAVANQLEEWTNARLISGAVGAIVGAVWNYITTALAVW
jgi:dolichol-phosphate mannosyltransferase